MAQVTLCRAGNEEKASSERLPILGHCNPVTVILGVTARMHDLPRLNLGVCQHS